jgi:hypothetical protein
MMRFLVLEGEVVHIDDRSHRQFTVYYSGEVNRALCLFFNLTMCGVNFCWVASVNCGDYR